MKKTEKPALVPIPNRSNDLPDLPNAIVNFKVVELFGAFNAVHSLAKLLNSQSLRALQIFQQEKGHEQYGYATFDEFLDNYDGSPFKKTAYYEKIALLEKEGDAVFDLLNELKISKNARKLLAKGAVEIDGDTVIVGDVRASLGNNNAVKELVKALAQENARATAYADALEKKTADLQTKLKQGAADFENLRREQIGSDTFSAALTRTLGEMLTLSQEAEQLTLTEVERRADVALRSLWTQFLILRRSLRREHIFAFEDEFNPSPAIRHAAATTAEQQAGESETDYARRLVRENLTTKDWNDIYSDEEPEN